MSWKLKTLLHHLRKIVGGKTTTQPKGVSSTPTSQTRTSNRIEATVIENKKKIRPRQKITQQPDQGSRISDHAHQVDPKNGSSNALDIVMGVDFGTSSTKVVVHAPYHTGNPEFAVPFGDLAHESLKYLLPTRLFISKDGRCSLFPISEASIHTDIKIRLMHLPAGIEPASGAPCDAPATTATTVYLALVLRYARRWFIINKKDIFGEFFLKWSFNLGLPAAVDDNPALREAFVTSGKAAWLVSVRPGPITVDAAQDAISEVRCGRDDTNCYFNVIPEVIAEVKGYAESRFRSPGLHLLIDIGASTLDVCSFNLREIEGDKPLLILTADIGMLGAKRLHLARINGAKEVVIAHAAGLVDGSDPLSMIPDDIKDYVPSYQETNQEIYDQVATAEKCFIEACTKFLRKTIIDLRKRRDPNSPRWCEKLPVFVCGGAKAMRLYRGSYISR